MTNPEFENEFDILFNNIMSNQAPGLDSYEKSVFLTQAKEQLFISYYSGKNSNGESFEETEEFRRYLSTHVKTVVLEPLEEHSEIAITDNSEIFQLPDDLWFITYEFATLAEGTGNCASGKRVQVVPVTQDDVYRTMENPFKNAGLRRALRLDIENNRVEIISKYTIAKYTVRYLERTKPIILRDLDGDLSINGYSEKTECDLPEALHRPILNLAVELASAAYKGK